MESQPLSRPKKKRKREKIEKVPSDDRGVFSSSMSTAPDIGEEAKGPIMRPTVANPPPVTKYKPLGTGTGPKYKPPPSSNSSKPSRISKVKTSMTNASKKDSKGARASSLNSKEKPKPLDSSKTKKQHTGSFLVPGMKKGESPSRKNTKTKKERSNQSSNSGIGSSLYKGQKGSMGGPSSSLKGKGLNSIRSGPVRATRIGPSKSNLEGKPSMRSKQNNSFVSKSLNGPL